MEGGVEHSDLRYIGHKGRDGLDAGDVGRIVERCQIVAVFHLLDNLVGDQHAFAEFLCSVDNAVTNGVNLFE